MKLPEFKEWLDREMTSARDGLKEVIDARPEGAAVVGKYEATNYGHLRSVIAEADEACPRAAETLRWLLWHNVMDITRIVQVADDLEEDAS